MPRSAPPPAVEAGSAATAGRWVAIGREALGALVALALSVIALRHVVATPRVALLWYDGDSVLLPLVRRSLDAGQPFEWAMSPALFFFPELPVYLLCSVVTATPQQALALNGCSCSSPCTHCSARRRTSSCPRPDVRHGSQCPGWRSRSSRRSS